MRLPRKQTIPYYAYCILRLQAEREWKVFPGIAERPVFPVIEGRLAMLVSRVQPGLIAGAPSVIQHGRVVHRVFAQHTVLPFRFGTVFQTEQQARQVLISNRSEFQDALNRLRGKAEMHLKMLFAGSGPASLLRGMDGDDRCPDYAQLAAERLSGLFQPLEEHISVRALQNGDWLVDFAHLIEDNHVTGYQRAYNSAAEQLKDCQLLVSGPWPSYHFLPSTIRMPAASETRIRSGRRAPQRRAMATTQAQAAKA